jgi:VWFA-related protein
VKWKILLAAFIAALVAISFVSGQNSGGTSTNPYEGQIQVASWPYSPAQAKIQVKSTLIDIGVVVRDAKGKPIGGLRKEDFQVFDNGNPRDITKFSVLNANAPQAGEVAQAQSSESPDDPLAAKRSNRPARYVGFFFDDANMEPSGLTLARKAVLNYLATPLAPGEKLGIFTTSGYVTTDFTSDVPTLQASLQRVTARSRRPAQSPLACPNIGGYQAYQIVTEGGTLQLSQAFQLAYSQAVQCNCVVQDPQGVCATTQIRDVQSQAQRVLDRSTDVALETLRSLLGVIRYMARLPGTRSIVLASDGFFTQNIQLERDRVVDTAAQAQIEINTVNAAGLFAPGVFDDGNAGANLPHAVGPGNTLLRMDLVAYGTTLKEDEASYKQDVLSEFSEGTGGTFFHNNNDLDRGVKDLAAAPDVAYLLAISGDNIKTDGSFHTLRVKVDGASGAKIAARRGFFAPSGNSPPDPAEIMRRMVLGSEQLNNVPVTLDLEQLKPDESVSGLRANLKVDLKRLPYRDSSERKVQRILFVTALLDTKGNFLTGIAGEMSLRVKPATLKKIEPQGADARVSLQAPPGQYRLREIVREGVHGKFTATTREVTIQ